MYIPYCTAILELVAVKRAAVGAELEGVRYLAYLV